MSRPHERRPLQILVAYDGSADAAAAVEVTAAAFPGAKAMVLSIWEPLIGDALRLTSPGGSVAGTVPTGQVDERPEAATREIARRAAEHACSLGLEAEPRWQADVTDVSRAIVDAAAREHADLIITGRRGLAGDRSSPDGSVAQRVLRDADRPVLVVPSAQTAEPQRTAVAARAVADRGLRVQVVPLEDV